MKYHSFSFIPRLLALILVSLLTFITQVNAAGLTVTTPKNSKTNTSKTLKVKASESAKSTELNSDHAVLDRIVAVVNHDAIPESELNHQVELLMVRLRQSDFTLPPLDVLRKQLLDKLIMEKLQLQMAKDANIEVDEKTIDKTLEEMASRDGLTIEKMKQFLEEQGIAFDQFKSTIKNEMIISKLQQQELAPFITISTSDVEHFMTSPAGMDQSGVEYRLGHILITLPETASAEKIAAANSKAEELVKQLKAGQDFSQLAMSKSSGPQALNGGDLGFRKAAELPTLFSKIAPTLTKGQVMGPIRNESGFHIVKLLDKRIPGQLDSVTASKEDLRMKAMDIIFQRKFEDKLVTWLRRIRDEAEVQVYLNES